MATKLEGGGGEGLSCRTTKIRTFIFLRLPYIIWYFRNIGAHVRSNICYLICLMHLFRSRDVTHRILFIRKYLLFFMHPSNISTIAKLLPKFRIQVEIDKIRPARKIRMSILKIPISDPNTTKIPGSRNLKF